MSFAATISDAKLLRDSIDTIAQMIDEGIYRLRSDGIEMVAADRAMVVVVDFKLMASAFDNYSCDKEISIGLNLLNFLNVLKRAGPTDRITLKLNEKENKLELTFEGYSTRNFSIPLLDISAEDVPPINQLEFSALAEVKSEIIEQGIQDASIVADSVLFELTDSNLKMLAEGDSSKAELMLKKDAESLTKLLVKAPVSSRYPLDYLKKMIRGGKLAGVATLQLGKDYPMRLEFTDGNKVKMGFVLAPRVSEE